MQKVLIANDLKPLLMREKSFLDRGNIAVFFAATNDELLAIHIEKNMNLIVTKLDMPGHKSEEVFGVIKQSKGLRKALTIILCENNAVQRERSERCCADAVLTLPVDPGRFSAKVRQFLEVAPRQSYRVVLNVAVEGKFKNRPFLCKTENISASGALIRTGLALAAADVISCSFYLPDGTKVSAAGEIVRIKKQAPEPEQNVYGIKFTSISPGVKSAIEAFVEKELRYK